MDKECRNSEQSSSSIYSCDYSVIAVEWMDLSRTFQNWSNRYGLIGLIVAEEHENVKQVEATAFLRNFVLWCAKSVRTQHADTFGVRVERGKINGGCINTMVIVNSQAGVHSRTYSTVAKYTKTTHEYIRDDYVASQPFIPLVILLLMFVVWVGQAKIQPSSVWVYAAHQRVDFRALFLFPVVISIVCVCVCVWMGPPRVRLLMEFTVWTRRHITTSLTTIVFVSFVIHFECVRGGTDTHTAHRYVTRRFHFYNKTAI